MKKINELANRGFTSIEEVGEALKDLRINKLDDSELVELTENLFGFPTIIDEVTEHPEYYMKGFDLFLYYNGVKGEVTPKLAEGQAQRIMGFRRNLNRHLNADEDSIKTPHRLIKPRTYELGDVINYFEDIDYIDIHDRRKLRAVLDGMTLALHCPEIIPQKAKEAFGYRWYNVKQFHVDYERAIKTPMKLKQDGRKKMFLEGVENLTHHLRRSK
tara:strand:- start:1152 stop:1796 length:645 start_codon:yes stop_codon:yes gene_type:complete